MPKRETPNTVPSSTDEATATDAPPTRSPRRVRPPEKVTVNLTGLSLDALDTTMELTGATKTEAINRALQVFAYLQEIWHNNGDVLVRENAKAEIERLRVF